MSLLCRRSSLLSLVCGGFCCCRFEPASRLDLFVAFFFLCISLAHICTHMSVRYVFFPLIVSFGFYHRSFVVCCVRLSNNNYMYALGFVRLFFYVRCIRVFVATKTLVQARVRVCWLKTLAHLFHVRSDRCTVDRLLHRFSNNLQLKESRTIDGQSSKRQKIKQETVLLAAPERNTTYTQ